MAKSNSTKLTIMAENSRKDALLTERGINHDPLLRRTANNAAHRRQGEEYDRLLGAGEEGEENNDQPAPPAAAPEENQAEEFFLPDLSDKEEEPTGEPSPQPDEDDDEEDGEAKKEDPTPAPTLDIGSTAPKNNEPNGTIELPAVVIDDRNRTRMVHNILHWQRALQTHTDNSEANEDLSRVTVDAMPDAKLSAYYNRLKEEMKRHGLFFLSENFQAAIKARRDRLVERGLLSSTDNDYPSDEEISRLRQYEGEALMAELEQIQINAMPDSPPASPRNHERPQSRPVAQPPQSSPAPSQPAIVAAAESVKVKVKVKDGPKTDEPPATIIAAARRKPASPAPVSLTTRVETSPPAPAPEKPRKDKDSDQPQPQPYRYRAGQPQRHPNHDLINRAKGGLLWLPTDHSLRQPKYVLSDMSKEQLEQLEQQIEAALSESYRQGYVPQAKLQEVNNKLEQAQHDLAQANDRATQAEEKTKAAEAALEAAKQEIPDNIRLIWEAIVTPLHTVAREFLLDGEPSDDQLGQVVEELIQNHKEVQQLREQVAKLNEDITRQQADQAELRKQLARHETSAGPDDVICELTENHDHEFVPRATHVHYWWKWLGLASCATALLSIIGLAILVGITSLSPPASSTAVQPEKSPSKTSSGLDLNFEPIPALK